MAEYISREETSKRIKECYCTGCNSYNGVRCCACGTGDAIDMIEDTTAADVAPVVYGRWQPVRESEMTGWQPELAGYDPIGGYICSACKEETVYDCNDNFVLSNYCPHCGAKMDGGAENAVD